jgi:ATP-dependent RNA helicase DDX35
MAEMPSEPRVSAVLLNSLQFGCSEEMLSVLAMCSVGHPFVTVRGSSSGGRNDNNNNPNSEARQKVQADIESFVVAGSDHLSLLKIYNAFEQSSCSAPWCASVSLQYRVLLRAREIRGQLKSLLKLYTSSSSVTDGAGAVLASCAQDHKCVLRCLVSGFFSHAAQLGHDGSYRTVRGKVAVLPHPQSVVSQFGAPPEWVIFNEIFLSKSAQIRDVSVIDAKWLLELAPHYYTAKKRP